MKKGIFAALAFAAILLAGCNPEKKDAVTAIALRPDVLPLTPGGSSRLSVVVTPENAKYNSDDLVWESSDTAVAVVSNNGTVTALEVGTANITVKYKELTGVCQVNVREWKDNLTFTGVYFGVSDTSMYGDQLDTIKSTSGQAYKVKKIQAWVAMFTAGFYLNNEGEFAGGNEGGVVSCEAPIYWAPGWANGTSGGTIFVLGSWLISDRYDPMADSVTQVIPCGKTNDAYIANMKLFLDNINAGDQTTAFSINMRAAGEDGCEGATLAHYQYHTTAEGYGEDGYYSAYLPELFLAEGYFQAEDNYVASDLMCSIEGHHLTAKELLEETVDDNNFYGYGCYWHYDDASESYSWNDEDVHWATKTYTYDYNLDIFGNGAASRIRGDKSMMEIRNFGDIQTTKKIQAMLRSIPQDPQAKVAK
ncbi:MAG: Ig-like domain-containing protein [Paludibacteraceae bacterium]|nr:Ig-like domain-containing protein [Paludibacteraceae bacterium]